MRPTGNIVVITGVSRGLGRAMTKKFHGLKDVVVGCARRAEDIEDLRKEFGKPHDFSVVDVVSDGDVAKWAQRVLRKFGSPDFLINNAALMNRAGRLWEIDADEVSAVVDVNVKGVINVIRHFAPAMVKKSRGIIVNFSSGWGRSTDAEVAPYCATKWAIEGLTQALAQELPAGMAAIALNPGIINTEMLQICFGKSATRYPEASEWVEVAVPYILSLGPEHNGQSLSVPQEGIVTE
jgi:NAD(P)-dependent dehydrogenase (short-subunit alcohol dehydrogenase family)